MTRSTRPDLDELARQARAALANARAVTLLIHGAGRVAASVLLYDDAGQPTFVCSPGSPVTAAGRHSPAALLRVPLADGPAPATVLLYGRLTEVGAEDVDGSRVEVVRLNLGRVLIEYDDPDAPGATQREVPLDRYRRADPEALSAGAARILRHTNASHRAELRRCAARLGGRPEREIAEATLTTLEPDRAVLQWLDVDGAHVRALPFGTRVETVGQLAVRLRERLAALGA